MPTELENLRAEQNRIVERIWAIERAEADKRNALLVGKCFRYRNSFGSGESWWLYLKIISVGEGGLVAHRFQTDSNGRLECEPNFSMFHAPGSGYGEISTAAFNDAWDAFVTAINDAAP